MEMTIEQVQQLIKVGMQEGLEQLKQHFTPQQTAQPDYLAKMFAQQQQRLMPVSVDPAEKGLMLARIVRSVAGGKLAGIRPTEYAKGCYGENSAVYKALAASDPLLGGSFVPPGYRNEFIEYLRPASVVRSLNPTIWPMPNGTAQVPMLTGGTTAAYTSENQNISTTAVTTGTLNLSAKKLAAIVIISNDLIRYSSPAADMVVRDDVVAAVAQREDLAFIRGDGLSNTPHGMKYWAPTSAPDNSIPSAGTTLANVTTDLGALRLALRNSNVRMLRCGWLMSPRSENYLMTIRDGNGNFAFRQEMLAGSLWGYPYRATTQIPDNLSTNQSEVYFADFADVVIGESEMLTVDTSMEAAYYDGSAIQAAFSRDQTVVRVIEEHDFGMRHNASVAILTGVTWGV